MFGFSFSVSEFPVNRLRVCAFSIASIRLVGQGINFSIYLLLAQVASC